MKRGESVTRIVYGFASFKLLERVIDIKGDVLLLRIFNIENMNMNNYSQ
jgi:hypothetical protein